MPQVTNDLKYIGKSGIGPGMIISTYEKFILTTITGSENENLANDITETELIRFITANQHVGVFFGTFYDEDIFLEKM